MLSYWKNTLSLRTDRFRMALFNNGETQKVMLFDHKTDPNETKNVAAQYPERVKEMTDLIKMHNHDFLPSLN